MPVPPTNTLDTMIFYVARENIYSTLGYYPKFLNQLEEPGVIEYPNPTLPDFGMQFETQEDLLRAKLIKHY
jgi:hypothetical protein